MTTFNEARTASNPAVATDDVWPRSTAAGAPTGSTTDELQNAIVTDSEVAALATIASHSSSISTLTSQVAAVATQSSLVAKRGLGTTITGATTVSSDLYGADATVPFVGDDGLNYFATYQVSNQNSTAGVRNSTVTTNSTTSVTRTAGTAWTSADTGSILAGTNIPANAIFTFLTSTTGTISIAATGSASTAATLTSPNLGISVLTKIAGSNSLNPPVFTLAPTGASTFYTIDAFWSLTAGVDTNNHTQQIRLHVRPGATQATGAITWGTAVDILTGDVLDGSNLTVSTAFAIGVTRPSFEFRINMTSANPQMTLLPYQRDLGFVKDH